MSGGYEGWANRATWNAALWIDNEYGPYKAKVAWLAGKYATVDDLGDATVTADEAREFFLEHYPHGTPDMSAADVAAINWGELAEAWETERLDLEPADFGRGWETSEPILRALVELHRGLAPQKWQNITPIEQRAVLRRAWELADSDETELHWGNGSTFMRPVRRAQ